MKQSILRASTLVAFGAQLALGTPSGLSSYPEDVEIPKYQGRSLPVDLLADLDDPKVVWVKPNQGMFTGMSVAKSRLADCDLISQELKIAEINATARVSLARLLKQAQSDYETNSSRFKKIVQNYEEYNALIVPLQAAADTADAAKAAALKAIIDSKKEISSLNDLIFAESDASKISDLKKKIAEIEAEVGAQKKEFALRTKEAKEARAKFDAVDLALAEAKGKKAGMERTMASQYEELGKIQEQFDKLMAASEVVLKKYSERTGGLAKMTADFAPAEYIDALKRANPKYRFQYVPSITATVDSTIPDNMIPKTPLEARIGNLILSSKWSNPAEARAEHPFRKHLIEKLTDPKEDAIAIGQSRISDFESSLTGSKFLSLELSILGYCAFKEPDTLKGQFTDSKTPSFGLALYYTYPVNYALEITGKYNSYSSLYDLQKVSKSSSWFGLSQSQKYEHIQRIAHSSNYDIKVTPKGAIISAEESRALREKVQEQLFFMAAQPHLDMHAPATPPKMELGESGASSVGKRLMMIPNPWTFWGGLVLTSLGEMFGSSESTRIEDIKKESWHSLNYTDGFTFLSPGDITIGDLKRAPVESME